MVPFYSSIAKRDPMSVESWTQWVKRGQRASDMEGLCIPNPKGFLAVIL